MVSLTASQRRTLDCLLHGASGRSRSKHIPDLKWMGYVDTHGHPTTRAWHALGKLRYTHQLRIPQAWEIATWHDEILMAVETPVEPHFDPHGPGSWSNAKDYNFILSIGQIMLFYRECVVAQQAWLDNNWTESDDNECDRERRNGWMGGLKRQQDHMLTEARRHTIPQLSRQWGCPTIGLILNNWGERFYLQHDLTGSLITSVSFKYSLQRNMDELHRFLAATGHHPDKIMYFARISVD